MKYRNGIRTEINTLYRNKAIAWLSQHVKSDKIDGFPKRIYLGAPTHDEEVTAQKEEFLKFCKDWHHDLPSGKVDFLKKNYAGIGEIDVPIHLVFENPDEIATWAGHVVEYHTALNRLNVIGRTLPDLIAAALDQVNAITSFDEADFERFVGVCKWLCEHRDSGCLIRQIDVRGVDVSWFEQHRALLLAFLRDYLDLNPLRKDLLQIGLVPPSPLIRVILLDRGLRSRVGGLRYFAASISDLEKLDIKPARVLFFEDDATALSIPDLEDCVIVIMPAHSIGALCAIPWIGSAKCEFLGSIDLRSFAMLNNVRVHLPNTRSLLMDQATLNNNKDLITYDDLSPNDVEVPPALTGEEMLVYRSLVTGYYGPRARLSQERIPLSLVFEAVGAPYVKIEPTPARGLTASSVFDSTPLSEAGDTDGDMPEMPDVDDDAEGGASDGLSESFSRISDESGKD